MMRKLFQHGVSYDRACSRIGHSLSFQQGVGEGFNLIPGGFHLHQVSRHLPEHPHVRTGGSLRTSSRRKNYRPHRINDLPSGEVVGNLMPSTG